MGTLLAGASISVTQRAFFLPTSNELAWLQLTDAMVHHRVTVA
jgi:hypothetical protein